MIFDWDAKKIINKSAINLSKKQNEVQLIEIIVKLLIIIYIKYIPHMKIDTREGIPHDLKKILDWIHLNEFNLRMVLKITQLLRFFLHLQMTKMYGT